MPHDNYVPRSCTGCRHACIRDLGYSNWTVEGHQFICQANRNPEIPRDGISYESYEDHSGPPYIYADQCTSYRRGKPNHYDVEDQYP